MQNFFKRKKTFMDNFRKTLAYKICGYSFFVLILIAIIFTFIVMHNVTMWQSILLIGITIRLAIILSKIIILLFIILSIISFVTQNKFSNAKKSVLADIGYICMLIISVLYFFALPYIIHSNIASKKRQNAYDIYLRNEYPTVLKNSCKLLNNYLPKIIEQLGADFTKEQLAGEFAKIENITNVNSYDNGFRVISYYRIEPTDTYFHGKTPNRIYISNAIEPCNFETKNCYIYLETNKDFGECQFYYDKIGKTVPTKETLELIK